MCWHGERDALCTLAAIPSATEEHQPTNQQYANSKWLKEWYHKDSQATCSYDVVEVWVHLQFSIASMVMLFSVFVVLRSLRFILILHQEPWYLWVPWVWIDQEYSRTGKLVNCVCEGEVNETTRKCVAWQTSPTCFSTKKKCQIQTSWSLWGDEMRFQSKSWMGHGSNISEKKFLHNQLALHSAPPTEIGVPRNQTKLQVGLKFSTTCRIFWTFGFN